MTECTVPLLQEGFTEQTNAEKSGTISRTVETNRRRGKTDKSWRVNPQLCVLLLALGGVF
ncbi:MAG: hypothetical protein AMJ61_04890 [Desulfobacterales bacterium SG8_35_2]|nr:MAG: hypothetical protein AMJ61_04890 [Desulfobacterales bacterium SG8_35_2]